MAQHIWALRFHVQSAFWCRFFKFQNFNYRKKFIFRETILFWILIKLPANFLCKYLSMLKIYNKNCHSDLISILIQNRLPNTKCICNFFVALKQAQHLRMKFSSPQTYNAYSIFRNRLCNQLKKKTGLFRLGLINPSPHRLLIFKIKVHI